jgi:hypothetical protein
LSPPDAAGARGRGFIIAFRLALLVAAAGAVAAAVLIGAAGRGGGAVGGPVFACPMHAEVRAPAPASCSICGMALERVGGAPPGRGATAAVPDTTAVENVRKHRIMDFVRKRALLPSIRELRGPAWVEGDGAVVAVLYDDQIAALAANEAASFSPTGTPSVAVAVRRTGEPARRWDASTSSLRFRGSAKGSSARAGDVGWLQVTPKPRDVLAVPSAAVLADADGSYVLVPNGAEGFERRSIRIGETFAKQGFAVVLDGLREHERVAARATFFLDAERKLDANRRGGAP